MSIEIAQWRRYWKFNMIELIKVCENDKRILLDTCDGQRKIVIPRFLARLYTCVFKSWWNQNQFAIEHDLNLIFDKIMHY